MSAVTDFLSNHSDLVAVATAAAVVTFLGFEAGWNSIMASDRNEQVFENKNKAYGAYRIRSMYGGVLAIAVFSGIFLVSGALITPVILAKGEKKEKEVKVEMNAEMIASSRALTSTRRPFKSAGAPAPI